MTLTYWERGTTQYRLVARWLPGTCILDCLAPYTPVKLVREISA